MQQAPQPASQSAEAALQALSESLDAERSNIGKNKLKKLRQKRSKLAKQVGRRFAVAAGWSFVLRMQRDAQLAGLCKALQPPTR